MKKLVTSALMVGLLGSAPIVMSHLNTDEFHQSYRQSYFALVGATFGPMASMVKGEMPWNDAMFAQFASELAALGNIEATRAFPDGSDKGTTRAKPGIWDDKADFESKFADFVKEAEALAAAAASGDQGAMKKQLGKTGGTCKACHDDYKSKDYLY